MADPAASFENRKVPTHSVGPYQFDVPNLAAGDSYTLDLREYEENGTKGYYVVLSNVGYDNVEIVNDTAQRLTVELNGGSRYTVVPNTTKSIQLDGVYRIKVINAGTASADGVEIAVLQTGMNADQRAKERAGEPPVRKIIRKFTGL